MNNNFFKSSILIFVLFFIVSVQTTNSQTIYISTLDNKIFQLNEDYTVTELAVLTGLSRPIYDIAIASNGVMYGISKNEIIQIDITNSSYTIIAELPFTTDLAYTSLVINSSDKIFALNNDNFNLYEYDIQSKNIEIVANLGFSTPGDLTFYQGKIIAPHFPNVIAYNFDTQTRTNIFCIPKLGGLIWGITNDFNGCESNRIIASTYDSQLWEFDIESGNTIVLDFDHEFDSPISGIASTTEYLASDCNGELEEVNCLLSTIIFNFNETIISPNPAREEIFVKSNSFIDFIEIFDINGRLQFSVSNPNSSINISALKTGMHILKIYSESGLSIKKLIVE